MPDHYGVSLEDSPQQKLFKKQLQNFEQSLKAVGLIGVVITFVCLLGSLLTKSKKLV
jgi:hypothetical protein